MKRFNRYLVCRNCGKRVYRFGQGWAHMTFFGRYYIGCKKGRGIAVPR